MKNNFGLWPKLALVIMLSGFIFAQFQNADDDLQAFQKERTEQLQTQTHIAEIEVVQPATPPPLPTAYSQGEQTMDVGDPDPGPAKSGGLLGFIKDYWALLLPAILALVEVIVRITPTTKDDSVFNFLKYLLDKIIPNARAGGGQHK